MQNTSEILKFISKHRQTRFYQPVIFQPNVLEIKGFWHDETIALAESICSFVINKHVLDVGCNTGFFLHKALEKGAKSVTGIDCDPHVIKLSQEIFSLLSLDVTLQEENLNYFVPTKIFDIIFMLNVLEVADNPPDCFNRFLLHSNLLIIEHEPEHSRFFSVVPQRVGVSSRANDRVVSYFA